MPNSPSWFFLGTKTRMARSRQRNRSNSLKSEIEQRQSVPILAEAKKQVVFLGSGFSPDEYESAYRRLDDFFRLLRKWRDKDKDGKAEASE